jgi:release factor glutamine methyltransferase
MQSIINTITQKTDLTIQQAWWLLEFVTSKQRIELQFSSKKLTTEEQASLNIYIEEIAIQKKPLAYILGWVPFLDLKLMVMPPTLIPRLETENWVYTLIESIKKNKFDQLTILDIGTGSGCIALSLAHAFPSALVYGIDISESALTLAQKNAQYNNITNVQFLYSNLFDPIHQHHHCSYSNLINSLSH